MAARKPTIVERDGDIERVVIAPGVTISWWLRGRVWSVKLECADQTKTFVLAPVDQLEYGTTLQ
jgi:hypothetical protein